MVVDNQQSRRTLCAHFGRCGVSSNTGIRQHSPEDIWMPLDAAEATQSCSIAALCLIMSLWNMSKSHINDSGNALLRTFKDGLLDRYSATL